MYADQVESMEVFHPKAYSLHFRKKASMFLVYNSPVEIALEWNKQLETIIRRPLDSFDALVLGQFNVAGSHLENTPCYRDMINFVEKR
jgi:hypothetical protein